MTTYQTKLRLLLIDGDVLAYQAAAATERIITLDGDNHFPLGSLTEARAAFDHRLDFLTKTLGTDDCILCFSGDAGANFRRALYPAYKANRAGKPRPVCLAALRKELMADPSLDIRWEANLEADDLLGLFTIYERSEEEERIIVSIDKDLQTIPGLFFNLGRPEEGIRYITPEEADRAFMRQALTGDMTDNYPGCPKYGPATADKALATVPPTIEAMWPVVLAAYEKAGLGPDYALTMARLARILREGEYDFDKGEVKLWIPPKNEAVTPAVA